MTWTATVDKVIGASDEFIIMVLFTVSDGTFSQTVSFSWNSQSQTPAEFKAEVKEGILFMLPGIKKAAQAHNFVGQSIVVEA